MRCNCGPGTISCNSSLGCVCSSGWKGSACNEDVNECEVTPNICGENKTCENTIGGYQCNCKTGYRSIYDGYNIECEGNLNMLELYKDVLQLFRDNMI